MFAEWKSAFDGVKSNMSQATARQTNLTGILCVQHCGVLFWFALVWFVCPTLRDFVLVWFVDYHFQYMICTFSPCGGGGGREVTLSSSHVQKVSRGGFFRSVHGLFIGSDPGQSRSQQLLIEKAARGGGMWRSGREGVCTSRVDYTFYVSKKAC